MWLRQGKGEGEERLTKLNSASSQHNKGGATKTFICRWRKGYYYWFWYCHLFSSPSNFFPPNLHLSYSLLFSPSPLYTLIFSQVLQLLPITCKSSRPLILIHIGNHAQVCPPFFHILFLHNDTQRETGKGRVKGGRMQMNMYILFFLLTLLSTLAFSFYFSFLHFPFYLDPKSK